MTHWEEDCYRWRGQVLHAPYGHWCNEWDGLPTDMLCAEFSCCTCYKGVFFRLAQFVNRVYTRCLGY